MLSLLPFYSIKLNERNQNQIVNQSWRVPVFVFCFSPYCGHCKEIHPDFTKAMDEFKSDPKIIVAEIDCFDFHSVCSHFYHVEGYPSFQTILKGIPTGWDGDRDYTGFKNYIEKLKDLKMDELCNVFDPNKKDNVYPAIVMEHPGDSKESCAAIDKFAFKNGMKDIIPQFYTSPGKDKTSFKIYLDKETMVQMNESYSVREAKKFINEYKLANFATVKWDVVFAHKRAICILISREGGIQDEIKTLANKEPNYYWSMVTLKKLKELSDDSIKVEEKDLPAVLVSNKKKNKYVIVKNANKENLKEVLNKEFSELQGVQSKYLKFVFRDLILFPGRNINRKLIAYGVVAVIICIVVYITYNIRNDSYYKFE